AVQVGADALAQLSDHVLGQAGVRAGRAGLRAVEARGDAALQCLAVDAAEVGRVGPQHVPDHRGHGDHPLRVFSLSPPARARGRAVVVAGNPDRATANRRPPRFGGGYGRPRAPGTGTGQWRWAWTAAWPQPWAIGQRLVGTQRARGAQAERRPGRPGTADRPGLLHHLGGVAGVVAFATAAVSGPGRGPRQPEATRPQPFQQAPARLPAATITAGSRRRVSAPMCRLRPWTFFPPPHPHAAAGVDGAGLSDQPFVQLGDQALAPPPPVDGGDAIPPGSPRAPPATCRRPRPGDRPRLLPAHPWPAPTGLPRRGILRAEGRRQGGTWSGRGGRGARPGPSAWPCCPPTWSVRSRSTPSTTPPSGPPRTAPRLTPTPRPRSPP